MVDESQVSVGNSAVTRFIINDPVPPVDRDLQDSIKQTRIDTLASYVGRMYVMSGIASLYQPAVRIFGNVSTVKCPPGDNLAVFKALTMVNPGDILVVDAQGFQEWCLGGFDMLQDAKTRFGLSGLVVNGAYRDIEDAQAERFPLYGKASAVFSGPKSGPGEINVPVCCGGVVVHPGDIVSGDAQGIVVVPRHSVDIIAEAAEEDAQKHQEDFDWIEYYHQVDTKISKYWRV